MLSCCRSGFITLIQPVGVSSCRFPLWARDQILCPLDFCGFVVSGDEGTGLVLAETEPKDSVRAVSGVIHVMAGRNVGDTDAAINLLSL
jgi:hypothetical protein